MEEKIKNFLTVPSTLHGSGYGSGNDYVYGNGGGTGYGNGKGTGTGYGYGKGTGTGYGYGNGTCYDYGTGTGTGDGTGTGYGYGNGNGSGNGSGDGIAEYNHQRVYYIDSIPTIIWSLRNNVALCSIIREDEPLESCYVVKHNNFFAHGKTIKIASQEAVHKFLNSLDQTSKIAEFKNKFCEDKAYPALDFYNWHTILTGSCTLGKDSFVKDKSIDLSSMMTVQQFLSICKNAYGWEIISKLQTK